MKNFFFINSVSFLIHDTSEFGMSRWHWYVGIYVACSHSPRNPLEKLPHSANPRKHSEAVMDYSGNLIGLSLLDSTAFRSSPWCMLLWEQWDNVNHVSCRILLMMNGNLILVTFHFNPTFPQSVVSGFPLRLTKYLLLCFFLNNVLLSFLSPEHSSPRPYHQR